MKSYRTENLKKLTTQDIIDIAVDLYDNKGFNRNEIRTVLKGLLAYSGSSADIDRIFDLVVG